MESIMSVNGGFVAAGNISPSQPSKVCPHCGKCPHCGQERQVAPLQPLQPLWPVYPNPHFGDWPSIQGTGTVTC